ncbi:MAG TPA: class I SAM-dependent methyltransferase [Gammaproteobacteria bacterium]|jgi:ubiquinone/menaquinone biosynthesis C-methylase UbiE|nr:class I SAM-dependent methyltransferase [Gammaproteobacteria bacterium]|tara:strand:+ start:4010 stop:4858 length:849 start_codon:yes stop_codon:yes gene_type:complete
MSEVNKNQRDFWSGKGGDIWVERQNAMDTMLSPLGEAALNKLNLNEGENVLDIGCGCGHTTLNIAKRISPDGQVTGLDISEPMLKRAKESANEMSISNASFNCVDVQTDDMGEEVYSAAFSRFGVMFFEDPVAAFCNINKSLITGASLSFVCWQSPALNPWQSLFIEAVKKYVDLPSPPPRSPSPFAFMESEYVSSILEESNFQNIMIEGHEAEVNMFSGRSLSDSVKDYISINPVVSGMLKDSTEQEKTEIINSAIEAFSPYYSAKGLMFPSATWLVTTTK